MHTSMLVCMYQKTVTATNTMSKTDSRPKVLGPIRTSRSEAKIDANAATIISRISRASKNVHGKSRESRKRRVVMAEQKKEHKKKRTAEL